MMQHAQVGQFLSAEAFLRSPVGSSSSEGCSYLPVSPRQVDIGIWMSTPVRVIGCKAGAAGGTIYVMNLSLPLDISENVAAIERIRTQLGRLRDGWCGPESRAPSTEVLSELDLLLGTLDQGYVLPEVEVDQDTGHLTLRWNSAASGRCLSLILKGTGNVLLIASQLGDRPVATSRIFAMNRPDDLSSYVARDQSLYETLYRA